MPLLLRRQVARPRPKTASNVLTAVIAVARKAELTVEEITDFYHRVDRVISYAGIQNRAVLLPTDVSPDLTFARAAAEVINQIGLARIDAQPQTLHWHDR